MAPAALSATTLGSKPKVLEHGAFCQCHVSSLLDGKHLRDRPAILYQALSEEYVEAFVAVNGDDLWLMHHFLEAGEKSEDYSKERFEQIIRHVSGLPEEPVEVISMRPWVMSPKVAMRFRLGRCLARWRRCGAPFAAGGLGLNTGLQSAHNLAWKLAAVVRGEADEVLLDSYETERHGAALQTMENTNENAGEVFAIVEAGLRGEWGRVRELVAHNRRAGAGLGQDLVIVDEEGAFVSDGTMPPKVADKINDYIPSACPGCRYRMSGSFAMRARGPFLSCLKVRWSC